MSEFKQVTKLDDFERFDHNQIKMFVEDWTLGEIFSHHHIEPIHNFIEPIHNFKDIMEHIFNPSSFVEKFTTVMSSVFIPIGFGAFNSWPDEDLVNLFQNGLIYEYFKEIKKVKRSYGTYPVFESCRVMHPDDWTICKEKIRFIKKCFEII